MRQNKFKKGDIINNLIILDILCNKMKKVNIYIYFVVELKF